MNKEDILKRSRDENNDEGYLFLTNKIILFSTKIFLLILVALVILTLITMRVMELTLLLTVLWSYLSVTFIGMHKYLKSVSRGFIYFSILITLLCFAQYISFII